MASHIGKKLILQTSLNDFDVQMLNGSPFYRRYDDFSRLFIRFFQGITFDSTFAYPVENREQETLDWYISTTGTPRKLDELQGTPEYLQYKVQRDKLFQRIAEVSQKSPSSVSTYLNYILFKDDALLDEATFCCDGKVIIAFWGLVLRKGHQYTPVISEKTDDQRVYRIDFRIQGAGGEAGESLNSPCKRKSLDPYNNEPRLFKHPSWRPSAFCTSTKAPAASPPSLGR